MDRKPIGTIDDNIDDNDCNSNDSNTSSSDDKTYHFRKGSDLDGFESFGALFADGLFTDLAICCAGRVFRCHRVVMAASSAYIKNALSAFNGSENNNNCNTVMILPQEIKVADMEAILQFIYNGQVEVTRDAIESFLSSAKALHIKGLANIKLVYNNNHKNHNNNNHNKNNKNPTNNSNSKPFNNENQNSQNFNHNNCNNNNENNSNSNTNNSPNKRRNGIIGGTPNRSPKSKPDLNSNHKFAENIPQNQSFHSSPQTAQSPQENDSKNIQTNARKKPKVSPKALSTNGFPNNTKETNGDFDAIEDEELTQQSTDQMNSDEDIAINDIKNDIKLEENDIEKSTPIKTNGTEATVPSMPCLIQIDADPTTFPSFCPENIEKSAKRRRSSSLRLEAKNQKNSNNSLVKVNRNNDPIKQMVRTSNRKLGFIQFHKKAATSIWNSSNKWKCEICNKLYGNKQTLKEHMDYFHSNKAEQIFTCTICAKEYTWKKSLMKHYRDIHQISSTSLSQLVASNQSKSSADETSTDVPALEWVTQSQDNSSQSK